jgi:hypothetical protein
VLGAIHEMLSQEKRRAGQTIVRQNAGQPEEDDSSSDPLPPRQNSR